MREIIRKIEQGFSFTTYEAKVFFSIYKGIRMSAAEIAKDAKIPRTSVYEILRSFARGGICNVIQTPKKQIYEIIDPKVIEDMMKIKTETDYKSVSIRSKECFDVLTPFYGSSVSNDYKVDIELIKGYNRIRSIKFLELVKNARRSILLMNRFRGNISYELDNASLKFVKNGGKLKSIYEYSTNFKIKINGVWQNVTNKGLIEIVKKFQKQGEEIRFIEEVSQIMAIFDDRIVYLSLYDESKPLSEMSDIVIKNKHFAKSETDLFYSYWNKADTLELLGRKIQD